MSAETKEFQAQPNRSEPNDDAQQGVKHGNERLTAPEIGKSPRALP